LSAPRILSRRRDFHLMIGAAGALVGFYSWVTSHITFRP
jgi:hypothetical protein